MKIKNQKKILLVIFSVFALWPALAAADTNLLQAPMRNIFQWAIGIISLLATVFLGLGAVQYITAGDNPETQKNAKDRMLGSLLGLILLISSVLIMNTINPQITRLEVQGLTGGAGVFYSTGNVKDDKPAPLEEGDSTYVQNMGYKKIKYTCIGNAGAPLIIWFYPNKYFVSNEIDYGDVAMRITPCGTYTDIQGESFKIVFQIPGVYFFLKPGCQGFMSEAFTADQSPIPETFRGKIKSMWIVNEAIGDGRKYGTIFHDSWNLNNMGRCTIAIIDEDNDNYDPMESCTDIKINALSANIFSYMPIFYKEGVGYIGPNIGMYSKPWGWSAGLGGVQGVWSGGYTQINGYNNRNNTLFPHLSINPTKITFDYKHVNETQEYKNRCPTFDACPGSIRILGNYLLSLYTSKPEGDYPYCQTFYSNINSVKETEFLAIGKKIGSIEVIAIGNEKGKEVKGPSNFETPGYEKY